MIELIASIGFAAVLILLLFRPQLGILAMVAWYPLEQAVPRLPLPGLNAETLLFGLVGALTLMRFGPRIPPLRYSGPILGFLMMLFIGFGVSLARETQLVAFGGWESFKLVKSIAFPTLLLIFAYWWHPEPEDRRRLREALSLAVGLAAAFGFVDFFLPFSAEGMTGRATGVSENPNILGGVLAAFGLVSLHLAMDPELSRLRRIFHFGIYSLAMVTLVLTLSRGAWLGGIVGHVVFLLYTNRRLLAVGTLAGALVLASGLPLLPEIVQDRIEQTINPSLRRARLHGGGAERFGGGADRIVYYLIAGEMFMESPIWGHGLMGFYAKTPQYGAKYGLLRHRDSHSIVVRVVAEFGAIGLLVFTWIGLTVAQVGRGLWRSSDPERTTGALLIASSACLLATNLFHTTALSSHLVGASFWLMLGLSARALQSSPEPYRVRSRAGLLPDLRRTLPVRPQGIEALRSAE